METNKLNEFVKKHPIWSIIGVLFVLFLIGLVSSLFSSGEEKKDLDTIPKFPESVQKSQEQAEKAKIETTSTRQESESKGIGVSRSEIIDVLEKPDIGFSFSKGIPIDGQDNYVADQGGNVVQLIGPEENLNSASIIAILGGDIGQNLLSLVMVVGIANIVDESSTDWVTQQFEKTAESPTKPYSNTKTFGQKEYKISFEPSELIGNWFTLTITPISG